MSKSCAIWERQHMKNTTITTQEAMSDDRRRYAALVESGLGIARETCESSRMSYEQFAKEAGCQSPEVAKFLETGTGNISGRDWERLISYCVLPEMWIYRARVGAPPDFELQEGPGATPQHPDEAARKKIRYILSVTSWFYEEATNHFLAAPSPSL